MPADGMALDNTPVLVKPARKTRRTDVHTAPAA